MLSELRNAIAHTNGRIEMLKARAQNRIRSWEKDRIGIQVYDGYIIVESAFLQGTFEVIRATLTELVERYKQWDSARDST